MSYDSDRQTGTSKTLALITGTNLLSIAAAVALTIVLAPGVYTSTMSSVGPWVIESYGDWAARPIQIVWGLVSGVLTYSLIQVLVYGGLRLLAAAIGTWFASWG